jgi:cell division protein FtsN
LLLGLPAFIEPKVVNNQTWYRVLVGPIETETSLNRVQALLANNDFESMPISAR